MRRASRLIVGVGSPHGDDSVGWKVAESLLDKLDETDVRIEQAATPIQILDWLDGVERLILCDACCGLAVTGETQRWVWPAPELLKLSWSGSHNFSLIASLQLAERLNRLPPDVIIWTVEAKSGNAMDTMSPDVSAAVPRLVHSIVDDLMHFPDLKREPCTNNRS